MATGRLTRRPTRQPGPLTERQVQHRLLAAMDEVAALGAAYQLTAGQIRWRLLLLEPQLREALEARPWAESHTAFGSDNASSRNRNSAASPAASHRLHQQRRAR